MNVHQAHRRIIRLQQRMERIDQKIEQYIASENEDKVSEFEAEKERRSLELNYLVAKYPV